MESNHRSAEAPNEPAINPTLAAALRYIARGWSVIPLKPGTKVPAVTELAPYLHGEKRMTADQARVCWTANPAAGVAIITGAPSGLVVVDIDPRNGGDCDATANDCPTELSAKTGGGGLHLFCAHPGGVVIPCGKTIRQGVDRKGDGGYVVAPPSVHPHGTPYRWVSEGEPVELPKWAVAPHPAGETTKHKPGWAERELEAAATPMGQ